MRRDNPGEPPATLEGDRGRAGLLPVNTGAEVRNVKLHHDGLRRAGWLIPYAQAYAIHEPWFKTRFNDYGELIATAWRWRQPCRRPSLCRRCGGGRSVPGNGGGDGRPRPAGHRLLAR